MDDAVDDASEVPDAISSGAKGDTDALWGQAAGIAVESACQFVAGFAGAPTVAVGAVAVEVGCAYASGWGAAFAPLLVALVVDALRIAVWLSFRSQRR
ncbi:hypothetical protein ACFYUE_19515 [Streptomyces bauhiniae]|uniref:hypothetical protein n=1 Tax=Streptomyces bauhiniae TaxID=2340725 RepID=UPI0036BA42C8